MGKVLYYLLTRDHRLRISVWPYRGHCVTARFTKTWGLGAPDGALVAVYRRPSVKKVKLSERSAVKHLAALESEYLSDVMPVVEQLALLQYDDGTVRQPGYLGVWTQGSAWVARVTDKDAEATLTAEGRTLDEALDLLGLLLGSEDAPWEPISRRKRKGG
jgi:hypothetical protein